MDNQKVIDEFRANGGKAGGYFEGMNLLLMTTIGAKSGKEYVIPVAYTMDGDKYVVASSKGGAPENPAWYHNLIAHPEITIEVGTEKFKVKAVDVPDPEREELYDKHAEIYPGFKDYKAKTTRKIPVFTLEKI